jgi:hypothetical protein
VGWERRTSLQSEVFNKALETLADAVEEALDMELLEKIIWDK